MTLMEMGFDAQKVEAIIPGCKSIEECLNKLCGRSSDEDSSEPLVQVEREEHSNEEVSASSAPVVHAAEASASSTAEEEEAPQNAGNPVWQQAAEQWRMNVARLQQKLASERVTKPTAKHQSPSESAAPSLSKVKQSSSAAASRTLTSQNVAKLQRRLSDPEDRLRPAKAAKLTTENVATLQRRLSEPDDPPRLQQTTARLGLAAASIAAASTSSVCSAQASTIAQGRAGTTRRRIRCKKSDEQPLPPSKVRCIAAALPVSIVAQTCSTNVRSITTPLSPLCSTSTASPEAEESSASPSPVTAVLTAAAAASTTTSGVVQIAPQFDRAGSPAACKPGKGASSKLVNISPRLLLMPTPQRRSGRRESMDSCKSHKSDDSERGAFQWSQFRAFATSAN